MIMFGRKAALAITTIIGKGACANGDLSAEGSARIDGTVEGDVKITGDLIVGSDGKINGDIEAQSAMIGGEVNGDVSAPNKVELTATAKVLGDIYTKAIVIDEHAVFQGKCDMNQQKPQVAKKKKPMVAKTANPVKKSAKAALQEALLEVKGNGLTKETKPETVEEKSGTEE